MKRRPFGLVSILLLLSLFVAGPAIATPVIVGFTGIVSYLDDPGGILDPSIELGSATTGSYNFDISGATSSPAICSNCTAPNDVSGTHWSLISPASLALTVEGFGFNSLSSVIRIGNDRVIEPEAVPGFLFSLPDEYVIAENQNGIWIGIAFSDSTNTRLSTEDLFENTSLTGWSSAGFVLRQVTDFGTEDEAITDLLAGDITTLSIIPEPSTALLLLTGLLGLTSYRRARARR